MRTDANVFRLEAERLEETILNLLKEEGRTILAWKRAGEDPYAVRVRAIEWALAQAGSSACARTGGTLAPREGPLPGSFAVRYLDPPRLDSVLDDVISRVRLAGGVPLRGKAKFDVRQAVLADIFEQLPAAVHRLVAERQPTRLLAKKEDPR